VSHMGHGVDMDMDMDMDMGTMVMDMESASSLVACGRPAPGDGSGPSFLVEFYLLCLGYTSLRLFMTALWCEEGRARAGRARRGPARWRDRGVCGDCGQRPRGGRRAPA
jgi:hypothetical protein